MSKRWALSLLLFALAPAAAWGQYINSGPMPPNAAALGSNAGGQPIDNSATTCTNSGCPQTAAAAKQMLNAIRSINNASSPYTVVSTDTYIRCDATAGNVIINLPAATATGRELVVKKTDASANVCTPTRAGSDTIDGATTISIATQYVSVRLTDAASALWERGLAAGSTNTANLVFAGTDSGGVIIATPSGQALPASTTMTAPAYTDTSTKLATMSNIAPFAVFSGTVTMTTSLSIVLSNGGTSTTIDSPSVDTAYYIEGHVGESVAGVGSCTQGQIQFRVHYTDALNGITYSSADSRQMITQGSGGGTYNMPMFSALALGESWQVAPTVIRVKGGTTVTVDIFQGTASNCATSTPQAKYNIAIYKRSY